MRRDSLRDRSECVGRHLPILKLGVGNAGTGQSAESDCPQTAIGSGHVGNPFPSLSPSEWLVPQGFLPAAIAFMAYHPQVLGATVITTYAVATAFRTLNIDRFHNSSIFDTII